MVRRTGIDPLAYMGVEPSSPTQFITRSFDPTVNDWQNFFIGDEWENTSTEVVWKLVSLQGNQATWVKITGTGGGSGIQTVTGDFGGAVGPDGAGNVNLLGGDDIIVTGNPGTNTLSVAIVGTSPHTLQIGDGSGGIESLPIATNGQLPIGSTGADPVIANLTAGANITITNGAGSITISAAAGAAGISSLTGNDAIAVSGDGAGNVDLLGGNNITITGNAGTHTLTANVTGTTNHAIQVGNASGSLTSLAVATNGQLPIGSTGANPVVANLTAGAGISITNGAGSISIAATGSGASMATIQPVPGNYMFTKQASSNMIAIFGWNGGPGGGSGAQGSSTHAYGGSGAAGGGGGFYHIAPATFYGSAAISYTVGAGGSGGASQAVAFTVGNNGSLGGQTIFGNVTGFTTTNSFGRGGVINNTSIAGGSPVQVGGIVGLTLGSGESGDGASISAAGTALLAPPITAWWSSGGGAGGQAITGAGGTGSNGGNILKYDRVTTVLAGGAGGVAGVNGSNGNNANNPATGAGVIAGGMMFGGTGGGGGGGDGGGGPGHGGNGGYPGGGGGGGGGSLNGTASGAGGNGADGLIIIIEW